MFKKRWRSGRKRSRSVGGVEGGVQEALEEWKEVFKKRGGVEEWSWRCSRSAGRGGRRCSRSVGGVEGGVQEALEEGKEVFKKYGSKTSLEKPPKT